MDIGNQRGCLGGVARDWLCCLHFLRKEIVLGGCIGLWGAEGCDTGKLMSGKDLT